jgi:uncharacterized membrane protein YkoI
MSEKVEVSVDADGNVLKCAKGANVADCGFTPGAKVCGKCGAMPIQMKMVPVTDDDYEVKGGDKWDDSEMFDAMKKRQKGTGMGMPGEEDDDEEMDDEDEMASMPSSKKKMSLEIEEDDEEEYDEDDEEEDDEDAEMKMYDGEVDLEAARKKRLASMGEKVAELGRNAYMCAVERKVYPGGSGVCDDCPGGCLPERGMPGLLSVEGIAEEMFKGKVLDSGYSSDADMFVVDIQSKSGRAVEVFIDGTTAEVLGFHKLDDNAFEQKSALDSMMVIDFHEAAEIAVKSIQGDVVAVEPDIFEGFDAYAVEIEGIDGKSYDVFVSLDGEVLGYDKYEPEEAEAIEAEAAEIALKRAFNEDMRTQMAEEGKALPDGSFPISNVEDLKNAISAYGRAKDKEAAKNHIMKQAKAMGQEKLIPANWVTGGAKLVEEKSGEVDSDLMASLVEFELLEAEVKDSEPTI